MLLISGGDRHGVEPNANINLTNAASFSEFVHECGGKEEQCAFYAAVCRALEAADSPVGIDALRHYPEFPPGSRTWDERFYHPDANGVARPLSELWPGGTPPWPLRLGVRLVQLGGRSLVSGGLRIVWSDSQQMRLALGEHDI